jgi:hypothetical protein
MSFERLVEIYVKRQLTLQSPKQWNDPFEQIILNTLAIHQNDEIRERVADRDCYYGQCWSFAKDSEALWRLYSHKRGETYDGVQIRTTLLALWNAIAKNNSTLIGENDLFIGKIEYIDRSDLLERFMKPKENCAVGHIENCALTLTEETRNFGDFKSSDSGKGSSFFLKLKEYRYEKEARLIYRRCGNTRDRISLKIGKPNELFSGLTIDARTSDEDYKYKRKLIKRLGYKGRIKKCRLYDRNNFDKEIEKQIKNMQPISQGGEDGV